MNRLEIGDTREVMKRLIAEGVKVQMCCTSPPYWALRDYGCEGQLGLESTPEEYIANMVEVFRLVRELLADDGTLWVNMGDSYAGSGGAGGDYNEGGLREGQAKYPGRKGLPAKNLVGIPWRLAFALQADGWILRSDIIWSKPNPMPESCTDRPTKTHEYVFLFSKKPKYFYDADAVREPSLPDSRDKLWGTTAVTSRHDHKHDAQRGMQQYRTQKDGFVHMNNPLGRNLRTVWTIPTAPYPESHFATFPPKLAETCIKAGSSERGICPRCGKSWVRVTTKGEANKEWQKACGGNNDGKYHGQARKNYESAKAENPSDVKRRILEGMKEHVTITWQPVCHCVIDPNCAPSSTTFFPPVPATILDPFAGSGTVGQVAESLGRYWLLIELNPEYEKLIMKRVAQPSLFTPEMRRERMPEIRGKL